MVPKLGALGMVLSSTPRRYSQNNRDIQEETMNKLIVMAQRAYTWVFSKVDYLQSPLLLAIRMYWGFQLAQSGWGKLHRIADITEFFTSLGIPMPEFNAYMVSNLEF